MPVNAGIYGNRRPVQAGNPLESMLRALQVHGAQQSVLTQQRAQADDEALRQATMQAAGDDNKLIQLLQGGGQWRASEAARKAVTDRMKADADLGKTRAETGKVMEETRSKQLEQAAKRIDIAGQAFGFVRDNPSLEAAHAAADYLGENGIWTPEQVQQAKARAASNPSPEAIKALATQAYQSALAAKDQLPSFDNQARGGTVATVSRNPVTGAVTDVQSAPVTESEAQRLARERTAADAADGRAVQIRGQNMADARAREKLELDRGTATADAGGPGQAALTKQFGKAPPGYRWKPDGSAEAIPGGPADIKAGEMGAKAAAKRDSQIAQAESVLDTIADAKKLVGYTTAGVGGLAAKVPMTSARDLAAKLETVKANLGFDRLQQMRDQSPTGGALGQVAVQELVALQSTVASLDQLQSPSEVGKALNKIEGHYNRWLDVMKQARGGTGGASGDFDKPAKPAGNKRIRFDAQGSMIP